MINAPLALAKFWHFLFIALSGYVNDYRTFGAFKNYSIWLKPAPKAQNQ